MAGRTLFRRVAELETTGATFAVATVVAVQRPTSARPGAAGIVHPDGTIEGWVGGSCAQPVVTREALRALVDGPPQYGLGRFLAFKLRGHGCLQHPDICTVGRGLH